MTNHRRSGNRQYYLALAWMSLGGVGLGLITVKYLPSVVTVVLLFVAGTVLLAVDYFVKALNDDLSKHLERTLQFDRKMRTAFTEMIGDLRAETGVAYVLTAVAGALAEAAAGSKVIPWTRDNLPEALHGWFIVAAIALVLPAFGAALLAVRRLWRRDEFVLQLDTIARETQERRHQLARLREPEGLAPAPR